MTDIGDYVLSGYKAGSPQWGSVGNAYGEKTHTMTQAELATHTHIQDAHGHTLNKGYGGQLVYDPGSTKPQGQRWETQNLTDSFNIGATVATNQNTGSSQAFNVIQPTRAALLVIKT